MDRKTEKTHSNGTGSHWKNWEKPRPSKARGHYINHWGLLFIFDYIWHQPQQWMHLCFFTGNPSKLPKYVHQVWSTPKNGFHLMTPCLISLGFLGLDVFVCVFCLPRCWAISSEEEDDVRCSWTLGLVFLECAPFAALQKKENGWEWNEWTAWLDQKIREFCFGCP